MNEKEALLTFKDVHRAVDAPLLSSNDIAVGVGSSRGMDATVNHAEVGVVASSGMVGTFNDDVEKMIREAQDSVCDAIEGADGGGKFKEDVWSRAGVGGGISRGLQNGNVWEKAGVNVSVVYGNVWEKAYRAANPSSVENGEVKPGPVLFFAAGIRSAFLNQKLSLHQKPPDNQQKGLRRQPDNQQ